MNSGVGCHFLFQGIFLTQASNLCLLCLLHWQADSLSLYHLENIADIMSDLKVLAYEFDIQFLKKETDLGQLSFWGNKDNAQSLDRTVQIRVEKTWWNGMILVEP